MRTSTLVRDAFERLYRERWADTADHARTILRGLPVDPADVAATAFTRLWAEIEAGRTDRLSERLTTLTSTVAEREAKRAKREAEYAETKAYDMAERGNPLAARLPTPETLRFTRVHDDAVRSLTPKQRNAYVLTQLRGLSYAEAGDVLGILKPTIAKQVQTARESIAAALIEGGVR
jgi:RNA polymerase sigma factor (sigma-70 family)